MFETSDFNQSVDFLEDEIHLNKDNNTISVELRGKPKGNIWIVIYQEVDADAASVIDSKGGIVKVEDPNSSLVGARIVFPPNSLTQKKIITISEEIISNFPYNRFQRGGPVLNLEPEGLVFDKKATLYMPYTDKDNDNYVDNTNVPIEDLFCFYSKSLNSKWQSIPKVFQDKNTKTIATEIDHFSRFTLAHPIIKEVKNTSRAIVYSLPFSPTDKNLVKNIANETIISAAQLIMSNYSPDLFITPNWFTILGAILTVLSELYDPVIVIPLTPDLNQTSNLVEGVASPNTCYLSGIVFLDFIGTERTESDLSSYETLNLRMEGRYTTPKYDSITLLLTDEMRELDPSYSYMIIPKVAFNTFNVPLEKVMLVPQRIARLTAETIDRGYWGNPIYHEDSCIVELPVVDKDNDEIVDPCDNCSDMFNPMQTDSNGNGIGDVCEDTSSGEAFFVAYYKDRFIYGSFIGNNNENLREIKISDDPNEDYNIWSPVTAYDKINRRFLVTWSSRIENNSGDYTYNYLLLGQFVGLNGNLIGNTFLIKNFSGALNSPVSSLCFDWRNMRYLMVVGDNRSQGGFGHFISWDGINISEELADSVAWLYAIN